jgi:hypothetical protein
VDKIKVRKLVVKIILSVSGAAILAYILMISFLLFVPKLKSYVNQTAFDSRQWQIHLTDRDTIKQKMVNDLLSNHQLIGMTQTNIDELLGKPPQTSYFKDYDYVYWLGPELSAFGIDSEWLGVKFDNGIVIKADILRD